MGGDKEAYARKENKKAADSRQQQNDILAPQNAITKVANAAIKANQQTTEAKGSKNNCNFCRKLGLQILPLRYSVSQKKAPQLPSLLGKNVKSVALSYSKYTTEMIDSGYIYAMVKRKKGFQWMGYLVTPMGYLSSFPLDKPAPVTVQEFACKGNEHALFASFVTVEYIAENLAEKIYIIYTHAPMTKAKREEYQGKADEYVGSGKWQRVDVAAWAGGTSQQEHCLDNTTLKLAVNQSSSFGSDRWNKIVAKFSQKPTAYASVALYDPIGITVKLNEYRNEAYTSFDDYLEKKDSTGITNQRKLDAVQRLDTLKGSLEGKAKSSIVQNAQSAVARIDYLETKDKFYLNIVDKQIADAKKAKNFAEVARLEKSRQVMIEDHERKIKAQNQQYGKEKESRLEKLKADWQVCDDNIDFVEAENFKKEVSVKYETALKVANQRVQEHLNWIQSNNLQEALDVYDQKDLQSGCAFKAHVACMIFGMDGADAGAKQLDEWIKKPKFERKNLFIRGLYSNQQEVKVKHDEMVEKPNDNTALGIKLLKYIVDFMKKMDSAWDEYARVHLNPKKLAGLGSFSYAEQKIMIFVSNIARAFFRLGMGTTAESKFVNGLAKKLLYPQLGKLTENLRYEQLFNGLDPQTFEVKKPKEISHVDAKIDSKLAKAEVQESLNLLIADAQEKSKAPRQKLENILGKDMTDATNNYHQVRASGILIIIESINLAHMLRSGKYVKWQDQTALTASILAIASLSIDVFYGMAKGIRETASQSMHATANSAAIKGAANIRRGAIKFAAGSLGATAGLISAVLDFDKAWEQSKKVGGSSQTLKYLYMARGGASLVGSVGLSLLATVTYLEPVLKYVKHKKASRIIISLGENAIIKVLTKDAARAALLRAVAWVGGIGLLLTVFEVGVYIYMEFTKLKRWCENSTFRKDKSKNLMSEKQELADYQALFI